MESSNQYNNSLVFTLTEVALLAHFQGQSCSLSFLLFIDFFVAQN